jgi:quinol monooxygenase YgiN
VNLLIYQLKIDIGRYKTEEFVKCVRSYVRNFRKEKGCFGYSVYRDVEKENTFSLVGEWDTRQTMETHFKSQKFEVLIGATRVLGETFEINIGEFMETGGFQLAREKISMQPIESSASAD